MAGIARDLNFRGRRRWSAGRRGSPAVAADPDVAFVIDGDAVVRIRPIVALARAAPVADQVALPRSNSRTGGAGAQQSAAGGFVVA